MRKVFLQLTTDMDIRIESIGEEGYWYICNRHGSSAVVIQNGFLRRGVMRGCYIFDSSSDFTEDRILASDGIFRTIGDNS